MCKVSCKVDSIFKQFFGTRQIFNRNFIRNLVDFQKQFAVFFFVEAQQVLNDSFSQLTRSIYDFGFFFSSRVNFETIFVSFEFTANYRFTHKIYLKVYRHHLMNLIRFQQFFSRNFQFFQFSWPARFSLQNLSTILLRSLRYFFIFLLGKVCPILKTFFSNILNI